MIDIAGLVASLIFIFPIISAIVIFFAKRPLEASGYIAFFSMVIIFLLALFLASLIGPDDLLILSYPWIIPLGLSISLRFDAFSLLVLSLTGGLAALILLFSLGYFKTPPKSANIFYGFFVLFVWGIIGLVLAIELAQFFIYLELLLLCAYFLIFKWDEGRRPKFYQTRYFIFTQIGAVLILLGIIWAYNKTGITDFYVLRPLLAAYTGALKFIIFLFIIGFAIELGLCPFHFWLPEAYTKAPLPISIALSTLMAGACVYGLMRLVFTLSATTVLSGFSVPLMLLGVLSLIVAGVMAGLEEDVRRIMAYSNISQLGLIVFGLGALTGKALSGSVFHLVGHGLLRGGLFMCMGTIIYATGQPNLKRWGGLGGKLPLAGFLTVMATWGLVGLPPFCGFKTLWLMFSGLMRSSHPLFVVFVIIALLITGWYGVRYLKPMFRGKRQEDLGELPVALFVPIVLLSLAFLLLGVYPHSLLKLIKSILPILGF